VGFIPLLLSISGKSLKTGFFSSYACGIIFFSETFAWVFEVPGYNSLHHVILGLLLGIYFGLFGLIFNFIMSKRGTIHAYVACPFLWVCLEYLRSNQSFLSLPWPLLAHSQYLKLPIIQFSSLTGAYGVSFLIVAVNSAISLLLLTFFSSGLSRKTTLCIVTITAILTGSALIYGKRTLSRHPTTRNVRVSILQGNIDQEKKGSPQKYSKYIMRRYENLTRMASKESPDLIAWPEASTPGFVLKNQALLIQLKTLIKEIDTYFIIGSSEHAKFMKEPAGPQKSGNTALYFSPNGKVIGQYLKIRLLPFAETIPYKEIIPWPRFIVPLEKKSYELAGEEYTLFDIKGSRFGVIICWENAFPKLFRQFVKDGANFMINITNEGWFGKTAAPYQFLVMTVFRAVENRIPVVRVANTGISCFIDPCGRITGSVRKNKKDIFITGHLTKEISISEEKTFYTLYGDLFIYFSLFFTFTMVALSFYPLKN